MSEIKKVLIVFHYAEKIKSNLILTVNLIDFLKDMTAEERSGAEKLLLTYINALTREVNIAVNASGVEGFKNVNAKLEETISQIRQHNYAYAIELVSEAISITTTNGNQAAETLKDKDLI
ncbi:MAG: hypothetical protein ACUVQX_01645 [Candidatus Bathycorpusculaceae bacterium]